MMPLELEDLYDRGFPPLVHTRQAPARIYLRAGLWSRGESSMNWSTGKYERGTSVYPAKLNEHGAAEFDYDDYYMLRWDIGSKALEGRYWWVVTGKEICRGSDGEPVLRNSSIVARPIPIDLSVRQSCA